MCVTECPESPSLYADDFLQQCVSGTRCTITQTAHGRPETPPIKPITTMQTVNAHYVLSTYDTECPSNPSRYKSSDISPTGRQCVEFCQSGSWALDTNRSCVASCPTLRYKNYTLTYVEYRCVSQCPNDTFIDSNMNECVESKNCPVNHYGDPINGQCVQHCPAANGMQLYSDTNPDTKMCVYVCPDGFYIQQTTNNNTCTTTCLSNYFIDYTNRRCVSQCPNGTYAYSNGTCVTQCPTSLYADPFLHKCDSACTNSYFSDRTTNFCVQECPHGYYGDRTNGYTCQQTCTVATQFGHPFTKLCVNKTDCAAPYIYADNYSRQCVTLCPKSQDTWGDSSASACVLDCPWDTATNIYTYKDPSSQTCVTECPVNPSSYRSNDSKSCVLSCSGLYFAVQSTRMCELQCPTNFYEDASTKKCVSTCPQDPNPTYFDDDGSGVCVEICMGKLADPTTMSCITTTCPSTPALFAHNNKCITQCPSGTYQNNNLRTCDTTCTDIYSKDNSTRRCVQVCPTNPNLFSHNNQCVAECPDTWYSDNSTRKCVQTCNQSVGYLAYQPLKMCVLVCIGDTYSYQGECITSCPNATMPYYYIDESTVSCVQNCPDYYFKDDMSGRCVTVTGCWQGYYADPSTRMCAIECNPNVLLYKQEQMRQCVDQCPYGTYGDYSDNNTKTCRLACPADWYKDNSTWTCVDRCPQYPSYYADTGLGKCVSHCRISVNEYAYDINRKCVHECPANYFADNQTRRCLSQCLKIPSTYQLVNGTERTCVLQCPIGKFADNSTRKCETACTEAKSYAHWESRTCVSVCPATQTTYYYADDQTKFCAENCSGNTYRDPILRICMPECSQLQFADNSTGDCVEVCPQEPDMYGQLQTKTCVLNCATTQETWAENITRTCVKFCPAGTYADNLTQRCVEVCPVSQKYYGDPSTYKCVEKCPDFPELYADNETQQCVNVCPNETYGTPDTRVCEIPIDCPDLHFADPLSKTCVTNCPATQGTYADNLTKKCQPQCTDPLFADNSTSACVDKCPESPSYFGYDNKCVTSCPNNFYADNETRQCVQSHQCHGDTYGDPTSQTCVAVCPFNYYADTRAGYKICVQMCQQGLFADDGTKQCVPECPEINQTYGDNDTNKCVLVCPYDSYAQNVSRLCLKQCPAGSFADYSIRVCVQVCAAIPNLYGESINNTCVEVCPAQDSLFADNSTRLCVPECPFSESTFADHLTQRCVLTCPVSDFTYADNQTRTCQQICTHNDSYKSYADNSTLRCVQNCPANPQYYADNSTHTCVSVCPNNTMPRTYADNSSRVCESRCNIVLDYYSDNSTGDCLDVCPAGYFADQHSRACVRVCPGLNTSPSDTYGDQADRLCKVMCQEHWFAQNSSRLCMSYCPLNEYEDEQKRRCVAECDGQLKQYADNTTNKCVGRCPEVPDMFADNSTYTCVLDCPSDFWASNGTRECVTDCMPMYADNYTGRCVQNCPINLLTYADNLTHRCVDMCPDEIAFPPGTYADDSTKKCVTQCPTSPWTYAENLTRSCVFRCSNGTFGQNNTRTCVNNCSAWGTYADNSTTFCVQNCPADSFSDNNTDRCVAECPPGTYADNSTWKCVVLCPENPALYGDGDSRVCVINCPNDYYGDDLSRTCVQQCPSSPVYYTYEPTKRCYQQCLYPYFGQRDIRKCVLTCYWGQYGNLTTHRCETCAPTCTSCQSQLGCETCVADYYLFNGTCLDGCISSSGSTCISACPENYLTNLITYASPVSLSCVQTCPNLYYGLNSTLYCIQTCPTTYYASDVTRRCELCINGCNNCTNATYCFSCYDGYLFSNNLCIQQCSSTLQYYYGSSCISGCIDGTFLMSDRITCNNCSSICATCSVAATNCTKCVGAFLYNFNCVSKCPNNYYANQDLICVICTSTTPQCTVEPLTYTLTVFSEGEQLYGILTFNRQAFMDTSRIKQIMNISLNGVPSNSYSWDTTRINSTSYRINIYALVSLNEQSISLVFLKPDLVFDSLDTVMEDTTIEVPLPTYDYISPEVKDSTESTNTFSGIISYFALAMLVILMFKGSYPFLMVFEAFQMIYFHYFIIVELPYNYSSFLINLKYLNFQFLPSPFLSIIPENYQSAATPNKFKTAITDTTFFICAGHYFLVIAFYVLWSLVISLLKNKSINKFTKLRRAARGVFTRRIYFNAIHQCMWLCFMTFVVFGLWQLRDMSFYYGWNYANIVVAMLCVAVCLGVVLWNIYLSLLHRRDITKLPKKYEFILGDDSTIPYQMALRYIRKLLFCLFLFSAMIELQVVGMMSANFIILAFYAIYRPSKFKFNNIINILIELSYIGLQFTLILYVNDFELTTEQKLEYGSAMIAFSALALIFITIWMVWQFLQLLYDFSFVRNIVEETKIANQIHPDDGEDNLKVELEREYNKDEMISHVSGLSEQDEEEEPDIDEDTIVGIEKQYDKVLHYDDKPNKQSDANINSRVGSRVGSRFQNLLNRDNVIQFSDDGSVQEPRPVSSRNSSRMLFADLNVEDI